MSVFDAPDFDRHEELHFFSDAAAGLKAIIAVHRKIPGLPAGGGIRMWPYESESAALGDVLRLSRAMTYKLALAGIRVGSAKSVIIGHPQRDKTPALLRAFGRAVESLKGQYFCAEDVGIGAHDLAVIREETRHVVGLPGQDPSPGTAHGIAVCIRAAVKHRLGRDRLDGVRVAVQGLGNVGYNLCRALHAQGARLFVSDIVPERVARAVSEFSAQSIALDDVLYLDVDVLAPCALGEVIDQDNVGRLRAPIICGGANNLLTRASVAHALTDRNVLFVPDHLSNSGGVITVAGHREGTPAADVHARIEQLYDTCLDFFTRAATQKVPTNDAINRYTEERIERIFGPKAGYAR